MKGATGGLTQSAPALLCIVHCGNVCVCADALNQFAHEHIDACILTIFKSTHTAQYQSSKSIQHPDNAIFC